VTRGDVNAGKHYGVPSLQRPTPSRTPNQTHSNYAYTVDYELEGGWLEHRQAINSKSHPTPELAMWLIRNSFLVYSSGEG